MGRDRRPNVILECFICGRVVRQGRWEDESVVRWERWEVSEVGMWERCKISEVAGWERWGGCEVTRLGRWENGKAKTERWEIPGFIQG